MQSSRSPKPSSDMDSTSKSLNLYSCSFTPIKVHRKLMNPLKIRQSQRPSSSSRSTQMTAGVTQRSLLLCFLATAPDSDTGYGYTHAAVLHLIKHLSVCSIHTRMHGSNISCLSTTLNFKTNENNVSTANSLHAPAYKQ